MAPRKTAPDRSPVRYRFITEDEVDKAEVWRRIYEHGFACVRRIGGEIKSMSGLVVYLESGEL